MRLPLNTNILKSFVETQTKNSRPRIFNIINHSGEYSGPAASNQYRMQANVEVLVGKNPTLPSSETWAGCLMKDFLHGGKKYN